MHSSLISISLLLPYYSATSSVPCPDPRDRAGVVQVGHQSSARRGPPPLLLVSIIQPAFPPSPPFLLLHFNRHTLYEELIIDPPSFSSLPPFTSPVLGTSRATRTRQMVDKDYQYVVLLIAMFAKKLRGPLSSTLMYVPKKYVPKLFLSCVVHTRLLNHPLVHFVLVDSHTHA